MCFAEPHDNCENKPVCYYKQLKRKEQECEEFETALDNVRRAKEEWQSIAKIKEQECHLLKQALKDKNIVAMAEENEKLKAENRKLKEHLSFMDCVEARKEEEKQARMYFEKLAQKYKQALDEIENYSARISSLRDVKTVWEDILGIINKAKDGE